MSDFVGVFIGLFLGFVIGAGGTSSWVIRPHLDKCELNLPRTQKCELTAIPTPEKAK